MFAMAIGVELGVLALALVLAALVMRAALAAWRLTNKRRLAEASALIHRGVGGILADVEAAMRRLREANLIADDNAEVDECLERLTRLLERAGTVACVCSELCNSPKIARTRKTSELLRLLRINAAQIHDIRRDADNDLRVLETWIEAVGCESQSGLLEPQQGWMVGRAGLEPATGGL
jgi:hypothetical protein